MVLVVVLGLLTTPLAGSQAEAKALSEQLALQLGLSQPAWRQWEAGQIGVARSRVVGEGLWPNPSLSYSREQTFGDTSASGEDYLSFTQRIDFSGRRELRQRAARRRVRSLERRLAFRRLQLAAKIRRSFYDVLYRERRADLLRLWLRQLRTVLQVVTKRHAAGDVSGYARRRLARQRVETQTGLDIARATLAAARGRLEALVGRFGTVGVGPLRVVGRLLPARFPRPVSILVEQLRQRPDLRAFRETATAAILEEKAAGRWWVPQLILGAGLKTTTVSSGRATGFLFNASFSLPVFDRNQDEAQRAAAKTVAVRGRLQYRLRFAGATLRGQHARATQLLRAAARLRRQAKSDQGKLVQIARAAYRGGEFGVLNLLDAYRSERALALQALELAWQARRACIELDLSAGEEVP